MPIRITGMNSGLDTESIITELVKAKSEKKDSLVKKQTKLQWKQDAWKELNSKVYALYTKTLSNMRFESDYLKKTTKVGNANAATVITGSGAVNGVQTLKIDKLAKSGYLTGAKLSNNKQYSGSTKLKDLLPESDSVSGGKIDITVGGKTTQIEVNDDTTIGSFVTQLQNAGVNASFDAENQRFFISAKKTGLSSDFALTGNNAEGLEALKAMGLAVAPSTDTTEYQAYVKYAKKDASGNYVSKSVAELADIIQAEAEAKAKEVEKLDEQLAANAKSQEEITGKYTDAGGLKTKEELDNLLAQKKRVEEIDASLSKLAEIEEKLQDNGLTAEERQTLEDEKAALGSKDDLEAEKTTIETDYPELATTDKEELEKQLADRNKLDELTTKHTEIENSINSASEYFTTNEADDGTITITATEKMEQKVLADAAVAVEALNSPVVSVGADGRIATRIYGQDAVIYLNDAEFTSTTNTFSINGLTITANMETDEAFTITTEDDTDGIYDMVKNFFKEYNALINEMDALYNAESSKGYEPLTDEEKEAMNEKDIEKWEEKIKKSLLRKDSTLSTVASAMKSVMAGGVKMSNGKTMYLSDFGIGTLGYFNSADNEKNAYHIDGDKDDVATSGNTDKLKTAIANDCASVVEFFTNLSKNLYGKLGDLMKKTNYSSSFTLYDDVSMKDEYNDYKEKIAKQEQKITDFEDRYYKKFSAMETALAKLQSKESAIAGLLGM